MNVNERVSAWINSIGDKPADVDWQVQTIDDPAGAGYRVKGAHVTPGALAVRLLFFTVEPSGPSGPRTYSAAGMARYEPDDVRRVALECMQAIAAEVRERLDTGS
jgi:hypothetical protein